MSSPRFSPLAAIGVGTLLAAAGSASAWPGICSFMAAQARAVAQTTTGATPAQPEQTEATRPVAVETPTLRDPSSFVRVRVTPSEPDTPAATESPSSDAPRFSLPILTEPSPPEAGDAAESDGLIAVPDNARAGDPAFAEAPDEEPVEEYWYDDDSNGPPYGPYGVRHYHPYFIDGWTPGHGRPHPVPHSGRARRDPRDLRAFGSDDLHRRAELQFARAAAAPSQARTEAGFARAQLRFHRATLTPGVPRQADGIRREVVRPAPRPRR